MHLLQKTKDEKVAEKKKNKKICINERFLFVFSLFFVFVLHNYNDKQY